MDWKEFNEEKFKKDTDTTDLTDLEIADEAILSLQSSYYFKIEGCKRIEKVALLAIYLLLKKIKGDSENE